MGYKEEDWLQLSGLQHFLFCRRQWALIHIEKQWAENLRTTEGEWLHHNAHNIGSRTKRGDILTVRAMRVHSARLGISGECDVVEFHANESGVSLQGENGFWVPFPVEYKRGTMKYGPEDEAQLCAQAICLEEMLCCDISEGALFYGEDRHRVTVRFSLELRQLVEDSFYEMHKCYARGTTPKVRPSRGCNACSLKELCVPTLLKPVSVHDYLKKSLEIDI